MADQFEQFTKEVHDLSHKLTKAIAESRDLLERTKNLPGMKTPEERAADEFAAQAVKSVLLPDAGLDVMAPLAAKPKHTP